jgi:hypothetical protein
VGQHDNQLYLGVFLCFASESEVCVLKLVCELGLFKLIRHCTVYAPDVSSQLYVRNLVIIQLPSFVRTAKLVRLQWGQTFSLDGGKKYVQSFDGELRMKKSCRQSR